MSKSYQLVVIGTGTAAMVAALRVRAAGWRVAVVDFRPFGGTCALRGCDAKKMLVGGAAAVDHAYRMHDKGVSGDTRIDWPALMAFKRLFTDQIPAQRAQYYAAQGIDAYRGHTRFTGHNTLAVNDDVLEAGHILIAAGAEPVKLGIAGEEHLITHEEFLNFEKLPARIVLVGGGYIAAEFSHIAARAGVRVTILQHGTRLLKHFDPDLVAWLIEKFKVLAIDVRTRTTVEAIEKSETSYHVRTMSDGQKAVFDADCVIHAAGRTPALAALDLEAGGIAVERGRLKLNEFLQSVSNPAVYAAGDAAQMGPPLTPVASHDAEVVATNLLGGNQQRPDYTAVPSVAFTIPPIAAVGLSEAQARHQGVRFRMKSQKASDWFSARQAAEPVYGFKVLVDELTDRVLGAHLVGPHADEVINLFALAIRHGLSAAQLKTTLFAYPTAASDIKYML